MEPVLAVVKTATTAAVVATVATATLWPMAVATNGVGAGRARTQPMMAMVVR